MKESARRQPWPSPGLPLVGHVPDTSSSFGSRPGRTSAGGGPRGARPGGEGCHDRRDVFWLGELDEYVVRRSGTSRGAVAPATGLFDYQRRDPVSDRRNWAPPRARRRRRSQQPRHSYAARCARKGRRVHDRQMASGGWRPGLRKRRKLRRRRARRQRRSQTAEKAVSGAPQGPRPVRPSHPGRAGAGMRAKALDDRMLNNDNIGRDDDVGTRRDQTLRDGFAPWPGARPSRRRRVVRRP